VVNTGAMNGLYCYMYSSTGLSPISTSWRSFNLSLTTPPATHKGPSQLSFTPDGKALVVVIKGLNPPVYIYTFSNGQPGQTPGMSASEGSINFAFVFSPSGDIILVDAAPYNNGSGIVALSYSTSTPSVAFTTSNYYLIPNQKSACWISYSSMTNYYYVSNAAAPATISVVSWNSTSGFSDLLDNPIATNASASDSTIITINSQDYLFVNDGSLHNLWMYKLSGSTLLNSLSFPRNDTGGQGVAGYVLTSSSTTSSATTSSATTSSATTSSATTSGCVRFFFSSVLVIVSLFLLYAF